MNNKKATKKVLLAIRQVDVPAVSRILGNEFDYLICFTLEQAKRIIETENIGIVICGVRFDSGNMFELLSLIRTHPFTHTVPYYLIVGEDAKYSYAILEGIRRAAKVRGVSGFINLSRLVYDLGDEEAFSKLREGVYAILKDESTSLSFSLPSFPDSMIGRRPCIKCLTWHAYDQPVSPSCQ